MADQTTAYGFTFGPAEVQRIATMPDGAVCLQVRTIAGKSIDVYVSPAGQSIRVFGSGSREWKPKKEIDRG